MKSITELKKEKLTIRTINPTRSTIIGMLIDSASKIAKEEHREPNEKDIELSAKRFVKEAEKDIEIYRNNNDNTMIKNLEAEIEILKEFIPLEMTEVEIRKLINAMPKEILIKKNMGSIMKEMKNIEHMNMQLLSKVLNEILK